MNLYAFVGNDPIVEWDIYGLAEHWEVTLWECKCLARCSLYSSDPDVECPEEAMAIKTKWTDKLYTFPIDSIPQPPILNPWLKQDY